MSRGRLIAALAVAVAAADLAVKWLAVSVLDLANRPHTVDYVPGQASGRSGLVSIAVFVALAVYVARRPTRRSVLGIGLVLGAACGNVLSIHLFAGGAPNFIHGPETADGTIWMNDADVVMPFGIVLLASGLAHQLVRRYRPRPRKSVFRRYCFNSA